MLVTPSRSLRVENPARQRDIHRKVRERAQAERNSHTRFHQSYQSMSALPRSLRVENPARQRDIHRKVRERAQAERNSHTRFHQSYQSMSGLLAGWLDDWDFGLDNCPEKV